MAFSEQFKIILWKDWKLFRQKNSVFAIAFELFFTFLILSTLSIRNRSEMSFESGEGTDARDISAGFAQLNDDRYNTQSIAFVLPQNQNGTNGDAFIASVMSDESISQATHINSRKFDTEQQLMDFVRDDSKKTILCGVVFGEDYSDYTIRISGNKIVDSRDNLSVTMQELVSQK